MAAATSSISGGTTAPPPPGATPLKAPSSESGAPSSAAPKAGGAPVAPAASTMALEDAESAEVVICQIKECFVYKIPPRKSAASHRADDWNINKWAWEGSLRVVTKGDQCVIRLEDPKTGELFAQAPIWPDQPVPVEAVIDSSRFFVLRIEDSSSHQSPAKGGAAKGVGGAGGGGGGGGRAQPGPQPGRHAFVGIGFRERPTAFDFQEAVYDHVKYLNKKKEAEEMTSEFHSKPAADFSLKAGQTMKLDIKRSVKSGANAFSRLKLSDRILSPTTPGSVPAPPPPNAFPVHFPLAPPAVSPPLTSSPSPAAAAAAAPGAPAAPATGTGTPGGADGVPPAPPLRQTSGEQNVDGAPSAGNAGSNVSEEARTEGGGRQENGKDRATSEGPGEEEFDDFGDFQAA